MAMGLTQEDSKFLSKIHKEEKEKKKKEKERATRKLTEPCDVEKVLVTKKPKEGEGESATVDLSGGLIRLMYYESLLSNTIGATYTYSDTGNSVNNNKEGTKCDNTGTVIDKLPLEGNETVELSFTDNRNNNLEVKLAVNDISSFDDKTTKSAAQIQLVSQEELENQLGKNRVQTCLEGKISQHVDTIIKESLSSTTEVAIEETAVNYNFIGGTRKPFYCINLLSTKASPQGKDKAGNTAGFIFWQTSEGYHFKSIDTLFGQPQKKSIIYNETPSTNDDDPAAGYDLKALEYSRDSAINVKNKLMMGAYSTELKSFDLYDPKWEEMPLSTAYDPKGSNLPGSQNNLTLAGEEFANLGEVSKLPSRIIWQLKDTGVQPGGDTDEQLDKSKEENFDLSNIYNQSIMRYNQLFSSTVTITIGGDFSLHAGDALWIDTTGLKADSNANEINEKDGGLYIISDLAHYISPKETYTKMNLIRDSTGRKGINAFRKGTDAHTIMQDGFLSNIK